MNTFQIWQIILGGGGVMAALLGGLYAVVTRPLLSRMDDINRRLDRIELRLDRIDELLSKHDQRITRIEERTSLLRH